MAAVLRIYADLPIDVDAPKVRDHLIAAALAAGCVTPRVTMEWRGAGHDLEMLIWCDKRETPAVPPTTEGAGDGEATPGSNRP